MTDNAQNAPVNAQEGPQRANTPDQVVPTANGVQNAPAALNEADLTNRVRRLEVSIASFMGQLTTFMESVNAHTSNVQSSTADVNDRLQALSDRVERLTSLQDRPVAAAAQDNMADVRASLQALQAADDNRHESVAAALGGFNDQFTKFLSDVAHTVDGIRVDSNQQLTSLVEATNGALQGIMNKLDSLTTRVNEMESQAADRHEQVVARLAPTQKARAVKADKEDVNNG